MSSPSLWQLRDAADMPPLASGLASSCAAAVVGGGIVGVACAYVLALRGLDVVLLEAADRLAAAASGRNGGFVVGSPKELERLRAVLVRERIACGYEEPGHLALASSAAVLERFQEEARAGGAVEALDRAGCEELLGRRIAPRFCGGRWQPRAGLLDPVRLVAGLARGAASRGAALVGNCSARRLARGPDGAVAIDTSRGRIACRDVVVACNAGTGALVPEVAGLLRPVQGRMLATGPGAQRRLRVGMAIDFGSAYWRQLDDGTVVVGGRDAGLERLVPSVLPGWPGVRSRVRWAGIMDQTPDGAPLLGPSARPGVWIAAGFGGHGIPPALAAAEAIARAIADHRPPAALDRLGPARFTEAAAA